MLDKESLLPFFFVFVSFPIVTSQILLCPEAEGFFADPFFLPNCPTFILCNEFVPRRTACPRGLGFDPISRTCQTVGSFNCRPVRGATTTTTTTTIASTSTETQPDSSTNEARNITDISRNYCPHIKTILDRVLRTIVRSVVAADGDCQQNCTLPTVQLECN